MSSPIMLPSDFTKFKGPKVFIHQIPDRRLCQGDGGGPKDGDGGRRQLGHGRRFGEKNLQ